MRKLAAIIASVLLLGTVMPCTAGAASVGADIMSETKQTVIPTDNPFDKQDNREVPYDSSYWEQPAKWRVDPIDTSQYKGNAKLWFDKIEVDEASAKGKEVSISFNVSGAEGSVQLLGFHIYYDTRLTPVGENGKCFTTGAALSDFNTSHRQISDGVLFYAAGATGDKLGSGDVFSIKFRLPANAKAGDLYPVGIIYNYDGTTGDLFYNERQNDEGKLQMTYVFTKGIENGYIRVKGKAMLGDANSDGKVNAIDASNILALYAKYSASGGGSPTSSELSVCDVNGDGRINAVDASKVLAYYAYTSTGGTQTLESFMK